MSPSREIATSNFDEARIRLPYAIGRSVLPVLDHESSLHRTSFCSIRGDIPPSRNESSAATRPRSRTMFLTPDPVAVNLSRRVTCGGKMGDEYLTKRGNQLRQTIIDLSCWLQPERECTVGCPQSLLPNARWVLSYSSVNPISQTCCNLNPYTTSFVQNHSMKLPGSSPRPP